MEIIVFLLLWCNMIVTRTNPLPVIDTDRYQPTLEGNALIREAVLIVQDFIYRRPGFTINKVAARSYKKPGSFNCYANINLKKSQPSSITLRALLDLMIFHGNNKFLVLGATDNTQPLDKLLVRLPKKNPSDKKEHYKYIEVRFTLA